MRSRRREWTEREHLTAPPTPAFEKHRAEPCSGDTGQTDPGSREDQDHFYRLS
jgi:hypothetical protein